MFGIGYRTTSYAFVAASLFLLIAGQPYHKYAFVSLFCALIFSYLKVHEMDSNHQSSNFNREIDYRIEELKEELKISQTNSRK